MRALRTRVLVSPPARAVPPCRYASAPSAPTNSEPLSVKSIRKTMDGLSVLWADGSKAAFDSFWLKENDPARLHPITKQRNDIATIPPDSAAIRRVRADPQTNAVMVDWFDGNQSAFAYDWLAFQSQRQRKLSMKNRPVFLWQNEDTFTQHFQKQILPFVNYKESYTMDEHRAMLERLRNFGFLLITQAPPDAETTKKFIDHFGFKLPSIYGDWWNYEVDSDIVDTDMLDTAYAPDEIPPHTDGTYMTQSPGLQVFHVLSHTGQGGYNTLVDSWNVLQRMKEDAPGIYNILTKQKVEWYHKHHDYDSRTWEPIVRLDETGNIIQFRYNDLDRAPPSATHGAHLQALYDALRALNEAVRSRENQIMLRLEPGTILVVNNWRVMHGRLSFTGKRRICGCYVGMDQFEGRLRALENKTKDFV